MLFLLCNSGSQQLIAQFDMALQLILATLYLVLRCAVAQEAGIPTVVEAEFSEIDYSLPSQRTTSLCGTTIANIRRS